MSCYVTLYYVSMYVCMYVCAAIMYICRYGCGGVSGQDGFTRPQKTRCFEGVACRSSAERPEADDRVKPHRNGPKAPLKGI